MLGQDAAVDCAGSDIPTPVAIGGLTINPGELYGFYVDLTSYPGASLLYTNGGPTTFTNADISLTTNTGQGDPAFTGSSFFPRQWNGTVYYDIVTGGKGDMNGDGHTDMVLRNVTNNRNLVWLMDGVTRTSAAFVTPDPATTNDRVVGVDDFDDELSPGSGPDGQQDLAFINLSSRQVSFWLMDGTDRVGTPVNLTGASPLAANWDLSATGDFNGDGNPDLVWRNRVSQKIVIWTMNGTAKTGNIIPTPDQAVHANWEIVAALDYNDDGLRDFLWYNATSGRIVTWYMDASVVRTTGQFTTPNAAGNNNWNVLAGGDYSAMYTPPGPPFGQNDIVWRNQTSGNQVVWHMDGNSVRLSGEFTNPVADTPALDWIIVGPK
jgi:hypothetical protein